MSAATREEPRARSVGRTALPSRAASTFAIVGPALIAFAIATYRSAQLTFWRDEFATAMFAALPVDELLQAATHVDGVIAPYYLLIHVLTPVLGDGVGIRLPSMLAFSATAAVVAWIALRWWGALPGLAAGIAFATNTLAAASGASARPYALAVLLVALAVLAADIARSGRRAGPWIAYAVAATAAVGMHVMAALAIAISGLLMLGRPRGVFLTWCAASAPAGAVTLWLLAVGAGHRGQLDWISMPDVRSAFLYLARAAGLNAERALAHDVLAFTALVLTAAVAVVGAFQRSVDHADGDAVARVRPIAFASTLLFAPWLLLLAVSWLVSPVLTWRYLVWSALGSALLVAAAVFTARTARRALAIAAGALAVVVLVGSSALTVIGLQNPTLPGDDFPALVDSLERDADRGDVIIVVQPYEQGGVGFGVAVSAGDPGHTADVLDRLPDGPPPVLDVRRITQVAPLRSVTAGADAVGQGATVWLITLQELTAAQLATVDPSLATCLEAIEPEEYDLFGDARLYRTECSLNGSGAVQSSS